MNEHIFDILNQKDFHELNPKEKSLVNQYYDEEAYSDMRLNILAGVSVLNQEMDALRPDAAILSQLLEEKPSKLGFLFYIRNKKVSLLKIAAIFLFLIGMQFIFILKFAEEKSQASTITITDTIFQIQKVHHYDTVYFEKKSSDKKRNLALVQTTKKSNSYATPPVKEKAQSTNSLKQAQYAAYQVLNCITDQCESTIGKSLKSSNLPNEPNLSCPSEFTDLSVPNFPSDD